MSVLPMKTLYFDCFAGASGDMILGACVAAGVEPQALKQHLSLLGVQGYNIEFEIVDRSGISATYARVQAAPEHAHRHLSDILKIIYESQLSDGVKNRAAKIFSRLAEAEARVHNQPVEKVHFHEVGGLDAIVDVVGAAICFELLAIERFVSSALHVGSGFVEMDHGKFPVPPPAVAELLKGVPFYSTDTVGELVTPTGAAIITTVCTAYGPIPTLRLGQTGYGAGSRNYEKFPNALRVLVGEDYSSDAAIESDRQRIEHELRQDLWQRLWMIETNLDDISPQILGHVMERAFELGALDCYFTSVQMKKNRPGVLLSILCEARERAALNELLFSETTTLGVRAYEVERRALQRRIVNVETQYGPIDVKVAQLNGHIVKEMPEYEQCRQAARKAQVPLRIVEEAARDAFGKLNK
ncbi:MAG TPA: nickel pincer cofactor biosynthesis protein LarC [Pyrinomonadaceae bacterium]|nr:nickel pincer cofactor biosynthesis protein LarC [Pyrinomonadaceae bacterium]